nr:hypothetical protein HmN_000048500 [Hymenolepis microstoma]
MYKDTPPEQTNEFAYLGVTFGTKLTWKNHIAKIAERVSNRLKVLKRFAADNEVPFCTQLLGHSMKADTPADQMRLLALETINANCPADQWLQVFTDGSYVENQANVGAEVYSELFTFFATARQSRSAFEDEIEAIKIALGQLCCRDTKVTNAVILSDSQLRTGHDCMAKHLHGLGAYAQPTCSLCGLQEEMEKTHLIRCPALQTATETQRYWEGRNQLMG